MRGFTCESGIERPLEGFGVREGPLGLGSRSWALAACQFGKEPEEAAAMHGGEARWGDARGCGGIGEGGSG